MLNRHWRHRNLSLWQPPLLPVTTKLRSYQLSVSNDARSFGILCLATDYHPFLVESINPFTHAPTVFHWHSRMIPTVPVMLPWRARVNPLSKFKKTQKAWTVCIIILGMYSGVGVTKPISSVPLFSEFFIIVKKTRWLLNITFIFGRYRRSSAAVIRVKYESDSKNLTGTFARSKFVLLEKLTTGALVTPTPGPSGIK